MFFPTSPHLPTVGDVVCFRHHHHPYTVALHSPDNTHYHLVGLDEPVRVETMAWYPQVGDRVEVLFCPLIRHLQNRFDVHNQSWYAAPLGNRGEIERKMAKIKWLMKWSINYRVGELLKIDGSLVQVKFSHGEEVLPLNCIAVAEKATKTPQTAVAVIRP